ncbi:SGNH/GDSL hydrolase family protein, partial [Candidatus Binatia bacterium]|nr:SGNH/GDSL hydrolase family protein [Candidatus Binatia bacterium]
PERTALLATGYADAPWRLAWVARRERAGIVTQPIDTLHPTRGWALTPSLRDVEASGAPVSSNARGARGIREHAIPKPPGTTRLLLFGDSYTFGEEVGDEQTFAAGIARRLPDLDVVNLGVHGYGHDQMLLHLREDAALYEPDIVLLGYAPWDDERNLLSFRDYAKPRFDLVDGRLELHGVPVPAPEEVLAREPWRSKLADLLGLVVRRVRWRYGDLKNERRTITDALLLAFVAGVRDLGARPVLVYFPTAQDVGADAPSAREREVAELCRAHDVPFLSLRERFRRSLPGYASRSAAHWNATEHDVAADEMATFLRDALLRHRGAAQATP